MSLNAQVDTALFNEQFAVWNVQLYYSYWMETFPKLNQIESTCFILNEFEIGIVERELYKTKDFT